MTRRPLVLIAFPDLLQMINKELNRAELGKFIAATPRDIPDVAQTTESKYCFENDFVVDLFLNRGRRLSLSFVLQY
jgi:hypothetical protein